MLVTMQMCFGPSRSTSSQLLSCSTIFMPLGQHQSVHTTISRRGLEEFFDSPENWGESTVKSGRIWLYSKVFFFCFCLWRSCTDSALQCFWSFFFLPVSSGVKYSFSCRCTMDCQTTESEKQRGLT